MENIVVVGTGDVFHRFIAPSLEILEYQRFLKTLATIDIKPRARLEHLSDNLEHRIRTSDEELSSLISDFKGDNPVVILAHDSDHHYSDAEDLVSNGFRVMIEKPYVTRQRDLEKLRGLISQNPGKIFLMEYYLTRKMIPVFLLSGAIKPESFYLLGEEVFLLRENRPALVNSLGKLKEILGEHHSLTIKIIESSGDSGKLEHRGVHVFDTRRGGGMIQDMGIHALMPLFVFQDYIGETSVSFEHGDVDVARSKEFYEACKSRYNISEEFVAETYAEIGMKTSKGIPVKIAIGKYMAEAPTQKNMVLRGNQGKIDMNMHENFMNIYRGNTLVDRIDLINTRRNRYYPVIRTGLEFFNGNNPFLIDLFQITLNAQQLTLNILEKARGRQLVTYSNGQPINQIFN